MMATHPYGLVSGLLQFKKYMCVYVYVNLNKSVWVEFYIKVIDMFYFLKQILLR